VTNPLIAAAIVSIMLNPVLYRAVSPLEAFVLKHPVLSRALDRKAQRETGIAPYDSGTESTHRAVIVGFGPIGQTIHRILHRQGIEPTVIELNIKTLHLLRGEGRAAVYGDANQRDVLERAGIAGASSLILSASGSAGSTEAIRVARELNPDIHVVARADYLKEAGILRKAGANEVFSGEGEVALAMAESILRRLGATPDQMDEARERIRQRLLDPG
jgi:CPA2 family monovalent cation:H+ antiporter-2